MKKSTKIEIKDIKKKTYKDQNQIKAQNIKRTRSRRSRTKNIKQNIRRTQTRRSRTENIQEIL